MFKLKIILVVASIDLTDGSKYILSKNNEILDLPSDEEINFSIETSLNKLLYYYTNFNNSWANIHIKKAIIDENTISLYYLTKIPYNSIIKGFWIKDNVASIIDKNIAECITYV